MTIADVVFGVCVAHAQTIYLNSSDTIYKLTTVNGQCAVEKFNPVCKKNGGDSILSIALVGDTLYYVTYNDLYRVIPGNPASCSFVTHFSDYITNFTCLTADKYGKLYLMESTLNQLIKYDPATNQTKSLGYLPQTPAGDLMFYQDKLLYATIYDGIYEVNIDAPKLSKQYMPVVGYTFFGLLSFPFDCKSNKVFGVISNDHFTSFIELDLDKKLVLGQYCTLPIGVLDAATSVDNGNTIGVSIDSINIKASCADTSVGATVQLVAFSAVAGTISYKMDNASGNNTGYFPSVSFGQHLFHLENQNGCMKDTVVNVPPPLKHILLLQNKPSISCEQATGVIAMTTNTGYAPFYYRIDNGPFQVNNTFTQLKGGAHTLSIRDAMGCQRDTVVYVGYINGPSYISALQVVPSSCNKTGQLSINIKPGTDVSAIRTALNNGAVTNSLQYSGLDSGTYQLMITDASNCRYDTFFVVKQIRDNPPAISITTTNQFCFANNGKTSVSIIGAENPYLVNFNKTGFKAQYVFQNLAPGQYPISINNKNGCQWDTAITVEAYPRKSVQYELEKINPDCDVATNGQLKLTVSGTEQPYTILLENRQYANGSWIDKLTEKKYLLQLQNNDKCVVDSAVVELIYNFKPECDTLYVPNAFSPNADGKNDFLKPIFGSSLQEVEFTVFSRYGQKLFESRGKTKGWDGKMGGIAQPSGAYTWTIRYKNYQNKERIFKGIAVLIR